jgi:hypothetical protein
VNCHIILAAFADVLLTAPGFCDGSTPSTKVPLISTGLLIDEIFPVRRFRVLGTSSSYENPTCTGWSIYNMLTLLFHDHGFKVVPFESLLMVHGPFSAVTPPREVVPGPPPT